MLSKNKSVYEILPNNTPIKPYFDLEMIGDYDEEACHLNLELFISTIDK